MGPPRSGTRHALATHDERTVGDGRKTPLLQCSAGVPELDRPSERIAIRVRLVDDHRRNP